MRYQQAIKLLRKYHPQLLLLPDNSDRPDQAMRVFHLRPGERLSLRSFGDNDYLYVLKGHANISTPQGETTTLRAVNDASQRFLIPAGSDAVQIDAIDSVLLYQVDADELDYVVSLTEVCNLIDPRDEQASHRAQLIRNSQAFHHLPIEAVAEAVSRLTRTKVSKGQEIVRQGEPGDAFYIIEEGEADVWEIGIYDDKPQLVNQLAAGDAFGEEALVMEGSRTATVTMTQNGSLLMLNKTDFDRLIKKQMVSWVDSGTAKSLLEAGYQLLDVRYEEEYEESYIPGAVLIPLPELRRRYAELDPDSAYVAYCKGGKRSAVACLLLQQRSYEAVSLTGGIRDWPHAVVKNE